MNSHQEIITGCVKRLEKSEQDSLTFICGFTFCAIVSHAKLFKLTPPLCDFACLLSNRNIDLSHFDQPITILKS